MDGEREDEMWGKRVLKSLNWTMMIFPVFFALSGGEIRAAEKVCLDAAHAVANALSVSAFGSEFEPAEVEFQGANESAHYTLVIRSKPVRRADGQYRPFTLKYQLAFDNDSGVGCALELAELQAPIPLSAKTERQR